METTQNNQNNQSNPISFLDLKQPKQTLMIKGQFMTIEIKSFYSKKFLNAELLLMCSQMIKAYSNNQLKADLDKILGSV